MAEQHQGLPIVNFAHAAGARAASASAGAADEGPFEAAFEPEPEDAETEAFLDEALKVLEQAGAEPDVLNAPNDPRAALLQSFLAEHAIDVGALRPAPGDGALEAMFDKFDPRWVKALGGWVRDKLNMEKRLPRPPFTDEPTVIANDVNIALLGDWGTGLYGAPACARSIEQAGDYQVLLHLGDVYYTGTSKEVQQHFLDVWPKVDGALSRGCNSNHEMYSGGEGYFHLTLPAFGQASSTFLVENDHWMFAGLDTAYHEHEIDDEQVAWLDRAVKRLGGRQLVLLSHHQPYSQLDNQGPQLQAKLGHLLEARRVRSWYWGHEHLLALYDPHPAWGLHGRCVGHSGFPYGRKGFGNAPKTQLPEGLEFRTLPAKAKGNVPSARILDGPNEYLGDKRKKYGPNGYMRLELRGPALHEKVLAPNGTVLWEGDLPA